MTTDVGCVFLTQGKRPEGLTRAVDSVLRQRGVRTDIVVVCNGAEHGALPESALPEGVRAVTLPENRGIPAGRNAGVDEVTGDLVLFVDDDAYLDDEDFLSRAVEKFDIDPGLGVAQPHVHDPQGAGTPRRYVPRVHVGDDHKSSDIVALWEGVCLIRRKALEEVGRWSGEYFFMHEGIELAWRMIDAGYAVRYCGDLEACHPAVERQRHPTVHYYGARNRVWLARRNLPVVLGAVYVSTWFLIDLARCRDGRTLRQRLRGYADGFRLPSGPRTPIGWRAVWQMTRAGRPPVI